MVLYSESCASGSYLAGSYGTGTIDFVVADYNHSPVGWEGLNVYRASGTSWARVEYENASDLLYTNTSNGPIYWTSGDVIEVWDLYMTAGSA
jgi:hypothetical protein